jgi:hypothetical protein
MKKIICVLVFVLLLCACAPATPIAPTVDIGAIQTSAVETAVAGANQTETARAPTATNLPTSTPIPTSTNTPEPQPIVLTGTGDNIVDVKKSEEPALLKAKYTGSSNFIVTNYGSDGEKIDLLINTIGSYDGVVPLDFLKGEQTARFEVKASGPWELQILPFSKARKFAVPTTITGTGDDVFIIGGGKPDLLKVDASKASRNFVVWAYGDSGRDLIVNEIAPYTGTVVVASSTILLVVTATGAWSLDLSAK